MFGEYRLEVLEDYTKKKASNGLAFNLIHVTPAKIKAECLEVFDTRFQKKDEKLLISFFGQREIESDYRSAIKQSEADKFKPLSNFLKASTQNTDEKNIELLAWLIDYEPRPYKPQSIKSYPVKTSHEAANSPTTFPDYATPSSRPINFGKVGVIISLLVLVVIAPFLVHYYSKAGVSPTRLPITGQEQCMFWTGDHYQPVLCSEKVGKTPVYALDRQKVDRLKMIMRPDTITKKSVGHIWYAKINGKIEFYTADGYHPIYTSRRLRPLSLYIYSKYVLDK